MVVSRLDWIVVVSADLAFSFGPGGYCWRLVVSEFLFRFRHGNGHWAKIADWMDWFGGWIPPLPSLPVANCAGLGLRFEVFGGIFGFKGLGRSRARRLIIRYQGFEEKYPTSATI